MPVAPVNYCVSERRVLGFGEDEMFYQDEVSGHVAQVAGGLTIRRGSDESTQWTLFVLFVMQFVDEGVWWEAP
jgi:hypothetical protein